MSGDFGQTLKVMFPVFWIANAGWTEPAIEGHQEYQKSKAEKEAFDKNAEILRNNAARKRLETSLNEDILRSQNRKQMSKARAAYTEAGMVTSATTSGVLGQMGAEQEQNVLNQRYLGETEAINYMNQATMQNYYGEAAKAKGKNAFRMGLLKSGIKAGMQLFTAGMGSGVTDVTGTAATGGNVTFTNASYMG